MTDSKTALNATGHTAAEVEKQEKRKPPYDKAYLLDLRHTAMEALKEIAYDFDDKYTAADRIEACKLIKAFTEYA